MAWSSNSGTAKLIPCLQAQVSTRTPTDRLRGEGDSYWHQLPSEEHIRTAAEISYIDENGQAIGHRVVHPAPFDNAGIRAPRADVMDPLRLRNALQPQIERTLPRTNFDVTQSMHLWHVGGEFCWLES